MDLITVDDLVLEDMAGEGPRGDAQRAIDEFVLQQEGYVKSHLPYIYGENGESLHTWIRGSEYYRKLPEARSFSTRMFNWVTRIWRK